MMEDGSVPSVSRGLFLTGVPPGDLVYDVYIVIVTLSILFSYTRSPLYDIYTGTSMTGNPAPHIYLSIDLSLTDPSPLSTSDILGIPDGLSEGNPAIVCLLARF